MAELSKNTKLSFQLNNKLLHPPKNWEDIELVVDFDNGQTQGSINTSEFVFILDAYREIKQHISDNKIFEGLDFKIQAFNNVGSIDCFDGFINLTENAVIDDTTREIKCFVEKTDSLQNFESRLEGLDFAFLYSEQAITDADFTIVEYQVLIKDQTTQAIFLSLTLLALGQQIEDLISTISGQVAELAGAGANPLTANVAIALIASIAIKIAFGLLVINETIKTFKQLANVLNPPVRQHKTCLFYTMLEKMCEYLGYKFNTSIDILSKIYFLPSNLNVDEFDNKGFLKKAKGVQVGLPNINDAGFKCLEFLEIVLKMFNAKYAIINNTIELHTELSAFWTNTSTYELPSILEEPYSYNTNELQSAIKINFLTDLKDEYTIENFEGTSYSVRTELITISDEKKSLVRNYLDIQIPYALGNRKEKLTGVETFLAEVAGILDKIINGISLGFAKSNLKGQIKSRVGVLKVTDNNHSVAKILYLENERLPSNHRQLFEAKVLWENGINELSFIENNYRRQRKLYQNVEIPFGFNDFMKMINNSLFRTEKNELGKITRLTWKLAKDKAVADYYIEDIYTRNLQEIEL